MRFVVIVISPELHTPIELGVTIENEARPVCGNHNSPLELYCLSEKSLKCVICKQEAGIPESDVVPIPEAVSSHKDRLRFQLRHLQAYQFTIRGAMEQVSLINDRYQERRDWKYFYLSIC